MSLLFTEEEIWEMQLRALERETREQDRKEISFKSLQ